MTIPPRLARLRAVFASATYEAGEVDRVRQVTKKMCVWAGGIAVVFFVLGLLVPSTQVRTDWVIFAVAALFVIPWWLVRRGHVYAAARLVLALWWIDIGALAATNGGPTAPVTTCYLVLIVAAGLMRRGRFLWITTLGCLLSLLALFVLHDKGWLPPPTTFPKPLGRAVFIGVTGLWLADLIRTTMAQLDAALRLSEQRVSEHERAEANLRQSELQLVQLNASLESRIVERTRQISEAKDSALAASRAKGDFLANMSHELRTPVAGMIGLAELLSDSDLAPEQKQMLATLQQSGETLLAIVSDVLDFSKIEAGHMVLEETDMDVAQDLRGVVALLAPAATRKGLSLVEQIDSTLPSRVRGDSVRLRQVLINLIGNAIKFTHTGGVTVQVTWHSGSHIRIVVRDTGIGISSEALARVFQPFMQADSSTTRRFGGTGLGLVISKRLVELMGGRLQMASEANVGSTVSFEIPAALTYAPAKPEVKTEARESRSLHVLVAEDNEVNAVVLTRMLKVLGHTHELVTNGAQALERVRFQPYDAILMDMQMPVMGGEEATSLIRQLPGRAAQVPIIGLTADAVIENRSRYLAAGLTAFMLKPCRRDDLATMLAQVAPAAQPTQLH